MTLIFLDVNVPMYAAGQAHALKDPCIGVLFLAQASPDRFVTDSEIFQEMIHRYTSIKRWEQGRRIFADFALLMVGRIEPVFFGDTRRAASLADRHPDLEARDLLHAAIMERIGVTRIVSTDSGFDGIDWIERLDPMLVDEWARTITG